MARICVVRQANALQDPRVRREIDALIGAGHEVDVICMRAPGEARFERAAGLAVHRLPMSHRRTSFARYLFEYIAFPLMAMAYVAWLDRRRSFDLVQVNTVPDWLVVAGLAPRLRGVPILLDLHECVPEFFASKVGTSMSHPLVWMLSRLEQASIRFATRAITCTAHMRDAFVSRGAAPERIGVVINGADESVFDPSRVSPGARSEESFSLISHGTIEERYGLGTIVAAVAQLRERMPGLRLEVYGAGSYEDELRRMVCELGVGDEVALHGFVSTEELLQAIADADAGVVAMKRDRFRDLTHCNKMFELIAMRKPVICSRTKSVMRYFPNGSLKYFESGDVADLARAIEELHGDPDQARRLVQSASAQNEPYRWSHQRAFYVALIEEILGERAGAGSR